MKNLNIEKRQLEKKLSRVLRLPGVPPDTHLFLDRLTFGVVVAGLGER